MNVPKAARLTLKERKKGRFAVKAGGHKHSCTSSRLG